MSTSDELWQLDSWGLDHFAWERDEEGPPIDLEERVDRLEENRARSRSSAQ
jgi:hypothetical protein